MESITTEQFELINGWKFGDKTTSDLLRDGGYAVKRSDGTSIVEYFGCITLGSIGSSDQVYYQQAPNMESRDVVLTGAVNQCIKVYANAKGTDISFVADGSKIQSTSTDLSVFEVGDIITVSGSANNNGTFTIASVTSSNEIVVNEALTDEAAGASIDITNDFRTYFKIFVREYAKKYAQASIEDIGVFKLEYKAYRFPLANDIDVKITHDDATVDAYGVTVTYYDTPQTRTIGGSDYQFNVIINANDRVAEEVYEAVQSLLRKNADIDSGSGVVIGKTADALLKFIGDALETSTGVYIDNFLETDINRLTFHDINGNEVKYPYLASGIIEFNEYLQNDPDAVYAMYYANGFGTSSATLVKDKDGNDIKGQVDGRAYISFSYDYDGDTGGTGNAGEDKPIVVVAIGLNNAQYVKVNSTITRSTQNKVTLISAKERNYNNPE